VDKYPNIQAAFYGEAWMILPETLHMMEQILLERASGARLSPEEVQARIGSGGYGQSRDSPESEGVAVIGLHGPIVNRAGMFEQMSGMTSPQSFGSAVRAAADDDAVSHIVLDIDTPGGTVSGTHDAAEAVRYAKGRKPVIAVANDLMASAGYYIGAQASKLVVLPSSNVGSISVIMAHRDLTRAEEKLGVKTTVFRTGENKALGHPSEALSERATASIQTRLEAVHKVFVQAVAEGRGVDPAKVQAEWADGSLWLGQDAVNTGLADEVNTLSGVLASLKSPEAAPPSAEAVQLEAPTHMEESMSQVQKPDLSTVPADVKAYVESLEAQTVATLETVEQIDMSTLPEPARKRLEALEAEATANREKAERAETVANQERDARLTREFEEKARAFDNLNMSDKELGGLLKRASASLSAEDYGKFTEVLTAANAQVAEAALFASHGSQGRGADGSAYTEMSTKAKELMAQDPKLGFEAAIAKVAETDPKLYDRYQAELS
jgi:signal peptide peptidase SppA